MARCLRSRPVSALTSPLGAVSVFSAVILLTRIPAMYGRALSNELLHETEHALYLLTALLIWVPVIGADPLPHHPPRPRSEVVWMIALGARCGGPFLVMRRWLGPGRDDRKVA